MPIGECKEAPLQNSGAVDKGKAERQQGRAGTGILSCSALSKEHRRRLLSDKVFGSPFSRRAFRFQVCRVRDNFRCLVPCQNEVSAILLLYQSISKRKNFITHLRTRMSPRRGFVRFWVILASLSRRLPILEMTILSSNICLIWGSIPTFLTPDAVVETTFGHWSTICGKYVRWARSIYRYLVMLLSDARVWKKWPCGVWFVFVRPLFNFPLFWDTAILHAFQMKPHSRRGLGCLAALLYSLKNIELLSQFKTHPTDFFSYFLVYPLWTYYRTFIYFFSALTPLNQDWTGGTHRSR